MTIPEIIDYHLKEWYSHPPSFVPPLTPTLRDRCANMIEEAMDLSTDGLASELKAAEEARDSWQRSYINRGDDLRRMTQCRDDAVAAAHLIAEEMAELRRKVGA